MQVVLEKKTTAGTISFEKTLQMRLICRNYFLILFFWDELVKKLADAYENKAFSEILKKILQLTQEVLLYRILSGKQNTMQCCQDGHLNLNGSFEKRIRTSLGEFKMSFVRVQCSKCKKTFVPLQLFMGMERYQTKTNELEKLVVEAACGNSYRRAVNGLAQAGKFPVSYQTAHGWVMKTDCDEIQLTPEVIGKSPIQFMPDGTKFKGEGVNGEARKGDLKVVIGITTKGTIFPMAAKAGVSWQDINQEWKEKGVKLPDKSIEVCDGEPGLAEALAEYASEQQRCHWHIKRDLYHAMHQDGGTAKDYHPIGEALAGALAIELPEGDYQAVTEEEKNAIEAQMENAEHAVDKMIGYFKEHGYEAAATYMSRAKSGMFGYVRRWLKFGLISPRASSMVERVMREIGRRIKKIAYGWSDEGATKIARIILKRFTNIHDWEEYWQKKMNVLGNVIVTVRNYQCSSQNLGH